MGGDKVIHYFLLGHTLIDEFSNLVFPGKTTGHIAILKDQGALARACKIFSYLGNGQCFNIASREQAKEGSQ
jgi:hypothetical protein